MKPIFFTLLLSLLLACSDSELSSGGIGTETTNGFQGTVNDSTGNSLSNVQVKLLAHHSKSDFGSIIDSVLTDTSGTYRFKKVSSTAEAPYYSILVKHEKEGVSSGLFSIDSVQKHTASLQLKKLSTLKIQIEGIDSLLAKLTSDFVLKVGLLGSSEEFTISNEEQITLLGLAPSSVPSQLLLYWIESNNHRANIEVIPVTLDSNQIKYTLTIKANQYIKTHTQFLFSDIEYEGTATQLGTHWWSYSDSDHLGKSSIGFVSTNRFDFHLKNDDAFAGVGFHLGNGSFPVVIDLNKLKSISFEARVNSNNPSQTFSICAASDLIPGNPACEETSIVVGSNWQAYQSNFDSSVLNQHELDILTEDYLSLAEMIHFTVYGKQGDEGSIELRKVNLEFK